MKKTASLLAILIAAYGTALSAEPTPQSILATMKKVADWQLAQPPTKPQTDDWTYGALYAGMMAWAGISDSPKYRDAMLEMGKTHSWKPATRKGGSGLYDADDHCVSQTYLELYLKDKDAEMIKPTKERFDYILANPATNSLQFSRDARARWAWCDAIFMGPPAWIRMYAATGDKKYLAFMDSEFWKTSDFLYDKDEHLYFRDSTYFEKREANGKKIFWSRGNGWVLAGLARVLQYLPADFPHRKQYEHQFKEIAAKTASLQQPDGLWRPSLLDPVSYPLKETSGSGFYTFGLAWGINHGLLERQKYEPVVLKGWKALVECVNADGKLEHVQPVGADPKKFDPEHTEVFGVGAFLLAGSEMYRLRGGK